MASDEVLADSVSTGADESLEPYSVAWWESRTAEELRDIIKRGFASGPALRGAVAEVERRACEATTRLREKAVLGAEARRKQLRMIAAAASVLTLAALLTWWFAG